MGGIAAVHPSPTSTGDGGALPPLSSESKGDRVRSKEHPGILQRMHCAVAESLYRFFFGLGCFVADRPALTISGCLLLTAACCTGFAFITEETRPEYLYTPQDAESFAHRSFFEEHVPTWSRVMYVYVQPTAASVDLLSNEALLTLLDLHNSLTEASVEHDGRTISFTDSCTLVGPNQCYNNSVLETWDYSGAAIERDGDTRATLNARNPDLKAALLLMNPEVDSERKIVGVGAWAMTFVIGYSVEEGSESAATALLLKMHDIVSRFSRDSITASSQSPEYLDQESDRALSEDLFNMTLGYIALSLFTSLSFFRRNPLHNLSFNGLISMLSIAMALASAYGMASLIGAPFSQAVAILPFILVGLGVDDAFVIVGEMRNVDPHLVLPVKERISKSLAHSGAAILVTSLTDFCAFISGVGSAVPAIRHASTYAALGAVFDFVYQVTVFVAGLVYKGRAVEARASFPLTCLPVSDVSAETRQCSGSPPKKYDPEAPLPMETLANRVLAPAVLHPVGKVIVLLVGVALTAVAAWQVPKVETDFNYEWFAPPDSPLKEAFQMRDTHFGGPLGAAHVVTTQGDYLRPESQQQLLQLGETIKNDPFVATYFSWFEGFNAKVLQLSKAASGTDLSQSPADFYAALCEYDRRNLTRGAIAWGVDGTRVESCLDRDLTDGDALVADPPILATRFDIILILDGTATAAVDTMNQVKRYAGELSEFSAFAYHYSFLIYEGYAVFKAETLKNVGIACACVFVVTLVMLADLISAVQVFLCVLAVDVCLVGFMGMVGLTYNAVTCLNIVFAVGIAVDYTMHITHSFLNATGTRQERARAALHTMGPSVVNGALSTLIGVLATAGSSAYVFRVFFLMMTATTVAGAFFGLAFMPALLSLVGSSVSAGEGAGAHGEASLEVNQLVGGSKEAAVAAGAAWEQK